LHFQNIYFYLYLFYYDLLQMLINFINFINIIFHFHDYFEKYHVNLFHDQKYLNLQTIFLQYFIIYVKIIMVVDITMITIFIHYEDQMFKKDLSFIKMMFNYLYISMVILNFFYLSIIVNISNILMYLFNFLLFLYL
jgi:hypothetical protein